MRDRHEPNDEFVEKLGGRLVAKCGDVIGPQGSTVDYMVTGEGLFGHRGTDAGVDGHRWRRGGGGVRSADQRAPRSAGGELRAAAGPRETQAGHEDRASANTEQRVAVGVANNADLLDARIKVAEAEAQVNVIESQLAEIRLTGQEPRNELSAPLVSGRDFVSQRLRSEMTVPRMALTLEEARVQDMQKRFEIGVADAIAVEVARVRMLEVQAAFEAFGKKLEIRQKFLKGEADTVETDLRVLEADAELQKRCSLQRSTWLARSRS